MVRDRDGREPEGSLYRTQFKLRHYREFYRLDIAAFVLTEFADWISDYP